MSAGVAAERFAAALENIWTELVRSRPAGLDRVRAYLDNMLDGTLAPPDTDDRQLFRRLYFPGLTPGPFYDPSFCAVRVEPPLIPGMAAEARRALGGGPMVVDHSDLVVSDRQTMSPSWRCVYFRKEFTDDEKARIAFPETAAFLGRHRLATEALFSRLDPFTRIEEHSDCANYVTTVHIALHESPAILRVGGESAGYHPGKALCFDSSFVHSVVNAATFPRDIILFNIWHPELSDEEIWALERIRELWPRDVTFDPDTGPNLSSA